MRKFVDCEREQGFLLPPDLRDWIPEDDLAHFVIAAVDRVAMSAFKVNERGTGSAQYHPRMMDLLLRQRDFFEPSDRAGDASRHRGSLCCGEPAP